MASWRYKKLGVGGKHPHYHWTTTSKEEDIKKITRLGGFIVEPVQEAKPPKRAIRKTNKKTKRNSK